MVFQNYAVWPHMNVFENVAFPLRVTTRGQRSDAKEIRRRVERALEIVGLSGLEDRMSTQLSGGQQQRLSFARAVVREPKVLLLDEPLSNLDAKLREQMRRDLKVLHHDLGITSLFVTHDQVEALSMSDRIGVMRAGKIVQEGTPEDVYHRPNSEFVATFIGSTNLVRGSVVGVDGDRVSVETPLGVLTGTAVQRPRVGDAASIAVRPEDLVVQRADPHRSSPAAGTNRLPGRIHVGMFAGSYAEYEVAVGDVNLSVRSGSRLPFDRGVAVEVEFGVDCTRVFSGEGLGHAVESADEIVETPATAEPLVDQAVVVGQA
jgi:iron(III) transport system ATP-binding protein